MVSGEKLRDLCDQNQRLGYHIVRGVGETIPRGSGKLLTRVLGCAERTLERSAARNV